MPHVTIIDTQVSIGCLLKVYSNGTPIRTRGSNGGSWDAIRWQIRCAEDGTGVRFANRGSKLGVSGQQKAWRRLLLARAAVVALAMLIVEGVLTMPRLGAQSSAVPQWQTEAGGKMAFDVASIKPNKSVDRGTDTNFPLTLGANFAPVGSLFSATNIPLRALIGFAYKLSVGQTRFLMPGLPSWVDEARFDINARAAAGNPTKDQFRLMVQSLLADRFKLAMRHETRQLPIFALVLAKAGKTGPQLTPHVDDAKCGAEGRRDAPPEPVDLSPCACGGMGIGIHSSVPKPRQGRWAQPVGGLHHAAFLTGTGYQGVSSDRLVARSKRARWKI